MFCIICDWTTYEEQGLTEAIEAMEERQEATTTFLDLARSIVEGEIIVVPRQEQVQTPTPEVEKEKAPEESIREVIPTPDQCRQVEREEQLPEVEAPGVDLNIPIQQEEEVLTQDPQPEIDQTPTTIRNTIRRAGAVVAGNTEITTATTRDSGTTSATRRPNNEARTAITRAQGNSNRKSRTTRNRTFTTKSGRRGDKESDLTSFGEGESEERITVTTRAPPKGETNRE